MAELQRWRKLDDGPLLLAAEAVIYGRMGKMDKAWQVLREAEKECERLKQDPTPLRLLAYTGMGLKDETMAILQEQCRKNPASLVNLKANPYYDPLRGDPRFDALIRCAHLEP